LAQEWPLLLAGLPAVVILLAAAWPGWWSKEIADDLALGVNVFALWGWGASGARRAGHRMRTCLLRGALDALVGVFIIVADALVR
jgi:hypothetical protein